MYSKLSLACLTLPVLTLPVYSKPVIPVGVDPQRASLYSPIPGTALWKCLDGSGEIPFSAVNDDFCDCKDGSDEPGTSACANGLFYCANEGHVSAKIRSSRVNDGLCEPECCDGSDEPSGVCPNICEEIGKEYRAAAEAEQKTRRTGAKIRSTYIAFAQKEKKRLEDAISALNIEVAEKRANEARVKDILERTEALDAAALAHKKESPLYRHLEDKNDILSSLLTSHAELKERITALEAVLDGLKRGYNPNYQDMAVLEAVRGWEALSGEADKDKDKEPAAADDSSAKPAEPPVEEEEWTLDQINEIKNKDVVSLLLEHEKHIGSSGITTEQATSLLYSLELYIPDAFLPIYQSAREWLVSTLSLLGVVTTPASTDSSSEISKARTSHSLALNALHNAENSLKSEQEALEKLFALDGFGKKGEWKKLKDVCLEKDTGEYTYTVCLFGSATQKSNRDGASNNLGRYSSWNTSPSTSPGELAYYSRQIYDHGAQCWNGPQRSVTLDLSCGTENALLSISEPEKCEYSFVGTTPALCWLDGEMEEAKTVKAEKHRRKEDL
ncbi:hypothetical protein BOTBODRAFT_167442 [Botryobasidium botryosum FD-172 SS1]|uniref:Glucosidase 2 subunit beta n=1 Tax=Botryobasidium botryosum (strain FD-172 SS1) TaxID=930990 RepID=A0A067LUJ6_BOTB1|nr:hypothetical protein BOTBODRAFT_167442 [Botryobasidium botryosum FD-172 SS1]